MTLRFPRAKFTYKRPEEQSADTKIQKAFSLEGELGDVEWARSSEVD